PGVEVRIVDENGNEIPAGEPGEIITRGPHVMKGYFRKPEATAARVRDRWLYTGDVGKLGADGYYFHLGRRDDMIITGGLKRLSRGSRKYDLPARQSSGGYCFCYPRRQERSCDWRCGGGKARGTHSRERSVVVSAHQSREL